MSGRNAPVWGSRYPRMPGLAGSFVVWPQAIGAAKTQQMETKNSFVIFIFASLIGRKDQGMAGRAAKIIRLRCTRGCQNSYICTGRHSREHPTQTKTGLIGPHVLPEREVAPFFSSLSPLPRA